MKTFAQYIFTIPQAQEPINLKLSKGWDSLKGTQRTITQVELRRSLKIMDTPLKVSVAADHPAYAAILALGEKSVAHVARFDEQARVAKQSRQGRKLIATIAALVSNS